MDVGKVHNDKGDVIRGKEASALTKRKCEKAVIEGESYLPVSVCAERMALVAAERARETKEGETSRGRGGSEMGRGVAECARNDFTGGLREC